MQDYIKTHWKDHIEENVKFKMTHNSDGTINLEKVSDEVIQKGTPVSARNLNNMEEGIYNANKLSEDNKQALVALQVEVSILKNAAIGNLTNNIFVENFNTLNDVEITHGVYDEVNKRLVI